jgi:hypothetical protein
MSVKRKVTVPVGGPAICCASSCSLGHNSTEDSSSGTARANLDTGSDKQPRRSRTRECALSTTCWPDGSEKYVGSPPSYNI